VTAVDLDVEEPNLHLFLKPTILGREKAGMEIPMADETKCNLCRACAEICQFKAISVLGEVLLTFPEMCHGCGGCLAVCPQGALSAGVRDLAEVSWGQAGRIRFLMGHLRIGEAMSPPLMRAVKARLGKSQPWRDDDVIIDAPPGASCPAINAVMDSEVIVLVTEPTPFGHYDLKLAVEAFTPLGKPMGVVVNRAGLGDRSVYEYCRDRGLPLLSEIPFDRRIAEAYSRGQVVAFSSPELSNLFNELARKIRRLSAAGSEPREAAHA